MVWYGIVLYCTVLYSDEMNDLRPKTLMRFAFARRTRDGEGSRVELGCFLSRIRPAASLLGCLRSSGL